MIGITPATAPTMTRMSFLAGISFCSSSVPSDAPCRHRHGARRVLAFVRQRNGQQIRGGVLEQRFAFSAEQLAVGSAGRDAGVQILGVEADIAIVTVEQFHAVRL